MVPLTQATVKAAASTLDGFPSRCPTSDCPRISRLVCVKSGKLLGDSPQLVEIRRKNKRWEVGTFYEIPPSEPAHTGFSRKASVSSPMASRDRGIRFWSNRLLSTEPPPYLNIASMKYIYGFRRMFRVGTFRYYFSLLKRFLHRTS